MITLFSCPKAFQGHIDIIQKNAIKSWTLLNPKPEIILFGNDEGIKEICDEFNLIHIPEVETNNESTPLVNSIFNSAQSIAKNSWLCYVNADIILFNDLFDTFLQITKNTANAVFVGQRHDLDITQKIDFDKNWEKNAREQIAKDGVLHAKTGKDYFIFPKGLYNNVPEFAIGRGMWDDWLVFYARKTKTPVVDLTKSVNIIHQNHAYKHIKGQTKSFSKGEEWKINIKLAGGFGHSYHIDDANFQWINNQLVKRSKKYLLKRQMYHLIYPFKMKILELVRK